MSGPACAPHAKSSSHIHEAPPWHLEQLLSLSGAAMFRPATVSKQVKTIVLGDLPVFFTVVSVASKLFWAQTALNACHSRSRALLAA